MNYGQTVEPLFEPSFDHRRSQFLRIKKKKNVRTPDNYSSTMHGWFDHGLTMVFWVTISII